MCRATLIDRGWRYNSQRQSQTQRHSSPTHRCLVLELLALVAASGAKKGIVEALYTSLSTLLTKRVFAPNVEHRRKLPTWFTGCVMARLMARRRYLPSLFLGPPGNDRRGQCVEKELKPSEIRSNKKCPPQTSDTEPARKCGNMVPCDALCGQWYGARCPTTHERRVPQKMIFPVSPHPPCCIDTGAPRSPASRRPAGVPLAQHANRREMSLTEARGEYASAKVVGLSSKLQELSVARFEVDALPDQREVRSIPGTRWVWGMQKKHAFNND